MNLNPKAVSKTAKVRCVAAIITDLATEFSIEKEKIFSEENTLSITKLQTFRRRYQKALQVNIKDQVVFKKFANNNNDFIKKQKRGI